MSRLHFVQLGPRLIQTPRWVFFFFFCILCVTFFPGWQGFRGLLDLPIGEQVDQVKLCTSHPRWSSSWSWNSQPTDGDTRLHSQTCQPTRQCLIANQSVGSVEKADRSAVSQGWHVGPTQRLRPVEWGSFWAGQLYHAIFEYKWAFTCIQGYLTSGLNNDAFQDIPGSSHLLESLSRNDIYAKLAGQGSTHAVQILFLDSLANGLTYEKRHLEVRILKLCVSPASPLAIRKLRGQARRS